STGAYGGVPRVLHGLRRLSRRAEEEGRGLSEEERCVQEAGTRRRCGRRRGRGVGPAGGGPAGGGRGGKRRRVARRTRPEAAMLRATGAKLGATISDGAVMPGVLVIGSDVRECTFDGKDLSGTKFVGCFLSGAIFHGARLEGAQVVDCFAPEAWTPVD